LPDPKNELEELELFEKDLLREGKLESVFVEKR
jgi:hypothetical protein